MRNLALDRLVANFSIASYTLEKCDETGRPGESRFRNTEKLTLVFTNGTTLTIDTFCSGSHEDTSLLFS